MLRLMPVPPRSIRSQDKPIFPTAPKGTRFWNYLIDHVLSGIIWLCSVAALTSVLSHLGINFANGPYIAIAFVDFVVVAGLYFFVAEWRTGKTLAKHPP